MANSIYIVSWYLRIASPLWQAGSRPGPKGIYLGCAAYVMTFSDRLRSDSNPDPGAIVGAIEQSFNTWRLRKLCSNVWSILKSM